ncbi:hypothetical protein [Pelotomaculum sp. FP]|uniref:hypothetical protein n=1 Tax=Pelotomaculum sp. FP TaxID=261474 RepID=UPI0032B74B06
MDIPRAPLIVVVISPTTSLAIFATLSALRISRKPCGAPFTFFELLALKGVCEAAVTDVPKRSASALIIIITIRNTVDNIMLFNLDVIVSDRNVKTTAKKNEPTPTKKIYLPVTVDLLLPKKNHLMRWLARPSAGYIIVKLYI